MSQEICRDSPLQREIHIWTARLDCGRRELAALQALLSEDELARQTAFKIKPAANRFTAARGILRQRLGEYLQCEPAAVRFTYSPQGKPCLAELHCHGDLHFNLSHSNDIAVYAFAAGVEVGVDVEDSQREIDLKAIMSRFFTEDETGQVMAFPPAERRAAFFAAWTRKEAVVKALGEGLHTPLDSFAISVDPTAPAQLLWNHWGEQYPRDLLVANLELMPGFTGSIAYRSPERAIVYRPTP